GALGLTYAFHLHLPSWRAHLLSYGITFHGVQGFDAATGSIELVQQVASAGGKEQPNQGFHVYLTVSSPHGFVVKHKVFWLKCAATQIPVGTIGFLGLAIVLALGFAVLQLRRRRAAPVTPAQ